MYTYTEDILEIKPDTNLTVDDMAEQTARGKTPGSIFLKYLNMSNKEIAENYSKRKGIEQQAVMDLLNYKPKFFFNAGSDLMKVTQNNETKMLVIEVNSVATGSMSFPTRDVEYYNQYEYIIENSFKPLIKDIPEDDGVLAVLNDANYLEAYTYAVIMARKMSENVYVVNLCEARHYNNYFRINDDYLEIFINNKWTKIRACYKYVQTKPWLMLPVQSKTFIYNSLLGCLAGGRNKAIAALAYSILNHELKDKGLKINHPKTFVNLSKEDVLEKYKERGLGVAKGLYGNGGYDIYFLTSDKDLSFFKEHAMSNNKYIYQDLVGLKSWLKNGADNRYFHIGTNLPDRKVFDLRMCIAYTKDGYRPSSMFSRTSKEALNENYDEINNFKNVLLTNIGDALDLNNQIVILDDNGFKRLGLDFNDVIDGFIQTVLAAVAVDKMACRLMEKGSFNFDLFIELNHDYQLYDELKSFNTINNVNVNK
jgi:hypothetical protein